MSGFASFNFMHTTSPLTELPFWEMYKILIMIHQSKAKIDLNLRKYYRFYTADYLVVCKNSGYKEVESTPITTYKALVLSFD